MQLADQDEFLKKLDSIKETAFLCGGVITEEQISEVFPELDDAKKKYLEDYLKSQHIGIGEAIDPDSYMTGEDINLLEMYMESLDETVRLSDSKKRVMMMDALNGDKEAKNALISHYLPDVVDTAKLYTGQGVNIMDLIGEGNVALAIAMQSLEVCRLMVHTKQVVAVFLLMRAFRPHTVGGSSGDGSHIVIFPCHGGELLMDQLAGADGDGILFVVYRPHAYRRMVSVSLYEPLHFVLNEF